LRKLSAAITAMTRRLIISKIAGGLGNQLFCYAAARRLALKNNAALCLDVNFFRSDIYFGRDYRLDCFALPPHEIRHSPRLLPAKPDLYWWRLKRKLAMHRLLPGRDWLIENDPSVFEPLVLDFRVTRTVLLDGYWQDERYFSDIASALRQDLAFGLESEVQQHELAVRIGSSNAVAVHSRRLHGVTPFNPAGASESLSARYYLNALKTITDRVSKPEFFCFGDDPRWLMDQWPQDLPVTLLHNSGPLGDIVDLWLMTKCRHFVIANSSFSWWGAWLGAAPDKIVLAPRPKGLPYEVKSAAGWLEVDW
jgi:hypothetical protein